MPLKLKKNQVQLGLFGASPECPDIRNLPCIVDPQGKIEVWAPGSVYQPLLLTPGGGVSAGPGALDENEERFVRHLIKRLYPAGDHPKSEKTPLIWQGKEVWFKRNIEKDPRSFRLRVDDSDWFYPDFIIWILDRKTRTQTFGFVDPKGLAIGAAGGWSDFKIVSTIYMPHVVDLQLGEQGESLEYEGEEWSFRVRGVLISTSSLESLTTHAKFKLRNEMGISVAPTEDDFRRARIVFQRNDVGYIDSVLDLLMHDTEMDRIVEAAARLHHAPDSFEPCDEVSFDLALRLDESEQSETDFVGSLLEDYLKPDGAGKLGGCVQRRRRSYLLDYAKEGVLGLGAEKASSVRDNPNPCEELWKRKRVSRITTL